MNGFGKFLLSSVGALLIAFTASAADQAGDKYYSVLGSFISADSDRNADDGLGLEGTLGWVMNDAWNIEIYAGYDTLDGDSSEFDVDQIAVGGNLLNVYRRGTAFQPYGLIGLGMVNSDSDFDGSDTNVQTSVGIGAFMPIYDDKVRIRTELVARWEDDSDVYQDWFINVGVAVPFGKKSESVRAAVVIVDSDGDGVPDAVDQCPGTPVGAQVDENGCELDSDGDGVIDRLDQCPGTPPNAPVDEVGCELDSDGDGVVDSQDECPDTPPNTEVDAFGCPFPQIIKLPEVNFRTDSVMLLDGADATLAAAAATLIQNPGLVVEVAGHSDSQGDANYNRGLSQRRADAVREYLVTAGVDEHRITAKGYGEDEPLADNSTADGRRENRRVELRVTSDTLD
jgi:OOP family OmpA-OmpF porin